MKRFILLLLLLSTYYLQAQTTEFTPNASFNIELGLPNNITNRAFRELMQGLAIVTPNFQYTLDNSFSIGAGLRYGYFNVNQFKNNIGLSGGLHVLGAFVKIGQEKYFGRFGIDYGVRVGYSVNIFNTNKNKLLLGKAYMNDGGFVEPVLGLCLTSTENSSFRLTLGYTFHGFKFQPHQTGIDQFSGFNDAKINEITTYFIVGFGYSYFFGKKGSTNSQ
ncbi:MAG: hypothetical protein H3C31_07860 [Brumimicrobium sp.]|nr:hypothetical protein [Brumimicrobium sp.]